MFKKGVDKRRSDRLMVSIPVRIQGKTKEGETFVREGSAIEVNRHGAQIQVEKLIALGRQVRLTNLISSVTGEFRVVRILEPSCADGMDFAVEAIELNPTFWGIHFPSQPRKPLESRALLECCRCHTVSLLPISLTDVEILSSGGVLMKPCAACATRTPWGYSRKKVRGGGESSELQAPGENESIPRPLAPEGGALDGSALLQRPISLRTASGDIETVQTESASSSGISCTSEKNYEVDQEITLRWAHPASARNYEARGRIIRRLDIGGSKRKIYSIHYESSPVILAEASSRNTPKLYLGFGLLLIAAAALIEPNVRTLTSSFFAHANTTRQIAGFGAALLAVCMAYKTWKIILACEPEDRTVLKRRHRVAAAFAVALFCGALLMGISRGLGEVRERAKAQTFLRDLAVAGVLEQNIDTAENRVLNAPGDYVDACSTLDLLVKRWMSQIGSLSADLAELRRSGVEQETKSAAGITCIQQVLSLDEQKARLVQQQIDLQAQAQDIPLEQQPDYWKANFRPLRQKILNLDAQKENLLQSLCGRKVTPNAPGPAQVAIVGQFESQARPFVNTWRLLAGAIASWPSGLTSE